MAENKKTYDLTVSAEVGDYEPRQAQGRNGDPATAALSAAVQESWSSSTPRAVEAPSADDVKAVETRLHYAAKKVNLGVDVLGYAKGSKRGSVKIVWQGRTRRQYNKKTPAAE